MGDPEVAFIEGAAVRPLRQITNERGNILHMLRADSPSFVKFGELYFSYVNVGSIKAWKRHRLATQNLAVPSGRLRVVLFDSRPDSASFGALRVIDCGDVNYCLITVPPGVWYGFQCLSPAPALIANCTDLPHDPDESETAPHTDTRTVPYAWKA